jgi:hypothetical protein
MSEMVRVFETPSGSYSEVPFLGWISRCEPTDYGWCGVMPDGVTLQVRAREPNLPKPELPKHHILANEGGRITGAYLIKRRRRRNAGGSRR